MKFDPSAISKQTGKIVVIPVITNATVPITVGTKWKDTVYYQVKGHNDYVQEQGG